MYIRIFIFLLVLYAFPYHSYCQIQAPFTSSPLTEKRDLFVLMVEGIDKFLLTETGRLRKARPDLWQRDFSSPQAFRKSIAFKRKLLAERLGIVKQRVAPNLEVLTNKQLRQYKVESEDCVIDAVRWNVLDGLPAEGLLVQPRRKVSSIN